MDRLPAISGLNLAGSRSVTMLLEAARLIYESNRQFYDLFSNSTEAILDNITSQMSATHTEVSSCRITLLGDIVAGVYCGYGWEETAWRQIGSLRMLMGVTSPRADAASLLREFTKQLEPVTVQSWYFARLAVHDNARRMGLGRILVRRAEEEARVAGYDAVSLHVQRGNGRSLRLFQSEDYEVVSPLHLGFRTLLKKLT